MARFMVLVAAAFGTLVLGAGARAADAPESWSPPEIEKSGLPATELMSGWYLRGDIGYRYNHIDSVQSATPTIGHDYNNVVGLGVGVGYKYQWFRSDVTFDYGARGRFRGITAAATAQPQYKAKIEAITGLLNAYIDLGTWWGLTPYVGGGVGISYLSSDDYANSALPVGETIPAAAKWNFSWAWMAGLSFQIAPTWAVDVGYRYLDLGKAVSSRESTGNFTTWNDLSAQEIRVGVRFLLD
jgi:opacity protein-like surface antigen